MTSLRSTFEPTARAAAGRAGIDPDLFVRQITQESGWDDAVIECRRGSSAGARGIAQIVPRFHPSVDPCNPEAALSYAADLMAGHLHQYGGDWTLALACYNAGGGATARGLAGTLPGWPYAETVDYVASILQISRAEAARRLVGGPPPMDVTPILNRVVELGRTQIGKPYSGPMVDQPDSYRWGEPGFDCSSFVAWLYDRATDGQVKLPGYTDAAYDRCEWVQSPQPGDIVFYFYPDEQAARIPHMGIWLSPTETLDCRWGVGVGVHPHVTQAYESPTRYRQTMRPKGLAAVQLEEPAPQPPAEDPRDAQIADLKRQLDEARSHLGVITVDYANGLEDLVKAIRELKPAA